MEKERNWRYIDGNKDNLPKRLGDYSFNLVVVMVAALFAEYLIKGQISEYAIRGVLIVSVVFLFGFFMYKKGGL